MTRGAWWLLLGFLGLAIGAWLLVRATLGEATDATATRDARADGAGAAIATPGTNPSLGATTDAGAAGRYAPFDCARPAGDAARVDGTALTLAELCTRLARIGAVAPAGTDREQARLVLDRMIDATLVRRALERAGGAVTDAELAAALKATSATSATADAVLAEQLRERLELRELVQLRTQLAVTEQDVDAELAGGAPGIDRGQGIRVEGWIARVPPNADAAARAAAQQQAEAFATAIATTSPATAATPHRMTPLAPFVVGEDGVEPDLQAAAFALAQGAWSAPIRTRVGWAVIRVLGAVEGTKLDDKDLRARVRKALETRKLHAAQQRLLEELRAAATIEIVVDV